MKVLHIQKVGGIAGSENYLLEVLPGLAKAGLKVEFLCLYNKGSENKNEPFIRKLSDNGIRVHTIIVKNTPTVSALKEINKIINQNTYDIIHTHLIHADFYLALTKVLFNRNMLLVSTKHGYEEGFNNEFGFNPKFKKNDLYFLICKFSEKFINRSFAISDGLKHFFTATGISSPNKIDRIHYGFDFSQASIDPDRVKYRFGVQQIVIVGRLVKFKGHRFALEALPKILSKFPRLKLVIVGSGNLETELKNLTNSLNLQENVIFTGYRSNIHDYMANSDIVLVPSISEGFGVVFLEAFNNKKPVIAFDVPAANEIIENSKSGILVEPYITEKLGDAVINLLENKAEQDLLSNNAYVRLKSYFNLNRMITETINFYEKVLL